MVSIPALFYGTVAKIEDAQIFGLLLDAKGYVQDVSRPAAVL